LHNASIIHYTYGQDHDASGRTTYGRVGLWHWDKRDWTRHYPTLPIPRPPHGTGEATLRLIEEVEAAGRSEAYAEWWTANMKLDR
jgi:hydroxyproline O-arabinosyltransferase